MYSDTLPLTRAEAIVTSDTVVKTYRAIYVGGAGNVSVEMVNGGVVTFTAPPVGTVLRGHFKHVRATGTTATLLIGMW